MKNIISVNNCTVNCRVFYLWIETAQLTFTAKYYGKRPVLMAKTFMASTVLIFSVLTATVSSITVKFVLWNLPQETAQWTRTSSDYCKDSLLDGAIKRS